MVSSSEGSGESLPSLARDELVRRGGELHLDAGTRTVIGVNAGEPGGRSASVVAGAVALRVGFEMREAGEDVELPLHLGEGLQVLRQLKVRAGGLGLPRVPDHAVRNVDEPNARNRLHLRGEGGGHRIEERQSKRDACALQE